jgi:putative ABC transport system permease protein
VRDLAQPRVRRQGLLSIVLSFLPLVFGVLLTASGYQSSQSGVFMFGTSLIIIGVALIARRFGAPDRAVFTTAGLGLVAWWLAPPGLTEAIFPDEPKGGIEMFFISGMMLVLGGVWALMYNYDLLLNGAVRLFGGVRWLAPTMKTAVSYPMQNRFRTGVTLALFSLVVFTLVVMAFITAAISSVFNDTDRLSGGFDLRSTVGYANPVPDMRAAIAETPGLNPQDFEVVAGLTGAAVQVTQEGVQGQEPEDLFMQGADSQYTGAVGYSLVMKPEGYETDAEVWSALVQQPGTAVVPYWMAPARVNYSAGATIPFQLTGFYVEDEILPDDVRLIVRDPRTGNEMALRVIGVTETLAMYTPPVLTSQETMTQFLGAAVPPQSHMYRLRPGVDTEAVGKAMESAFMANGFQATVIEEEVNDNASISILFNQLIQGFMALGLVVGIAALGVISARAVVERRHEIGMLRAVGFQKSMVQFSFLLEASFVALSGILLGVGLGLGLMPLLVSSMREQFAGLEMQVPWLNLALIIGIAYVASLLTTFLPARQAANVYPAEALRYE